MVTHDPRFAKHAQREVHLFDGKVVAEEELKKRWRMCMHERLWQKWTVGCGSSGPGSVPQL